MQLACALRAGENIRRTQCEAFLRFPYTLLEQEKATYFGLAVRCVCLLFVYRYF